MFTSSGVAANRTESEMKPRAISTAMAIIAVAESNVFLPSSVVVKTENH
jgi:hypothetical protein